MLAHRDGPRLLLDEAAEYLVVQCYQPAAYSGTGSKSSGSYALFMPVQAEIEDVTWVVKDIADQGLNNAPGCSTSSPFHVLPSAASCGAGGNEGPLCAVLCLTPRASRAFLFARALSLSPCTKSSIMSD